MSGKYLFVEADRFNNQEILSLSNSVIMSSKVPICFDRTPNYFIFEDKLPFLSAHHLLARDEHTPVGFLHSDVLELLSLENIYEPILCLGNLKVLPQYRGQKIAQTLIQKMAELGIKNNYAAAFCLVNEGNNPMLKLTKTMFSEHQLGLSSHDLGFLHTNSILFYGKKKSVGHDFSYEHATSDDLEEVISLYNQVHGHCFLAPKVNMKYVLDLFSSSLNLSLQNLRILRDRSTKRIAAFTLIWDQGAFKKLYINRYTLPLSILRMFIDMSSYLKLCKKTPGKAPWSFFEATYLTVKNKEPNIYECFLKHIFNEFVGRQFHFFNMSMTNPPASCNFLKNFIYETTKTHILYFHLNKKIQLSNEIGKKEVYVDTWFI